MDTPSILQILKKIPIFAELTEEDHKEIIKHIVLNYYPTGHVFFRERDAISLESRMFILKHGTVKISRRDQTGEDKEVAVLTDKDFFGEMAFVLNEPRNATALALSDCEIFELEKDDFMNLMEQSLGMVNKVSTEFIGRLKKNTKIT